MEIWKEVYKGMIPKDCYSINVTNSDEKGLIINLEGEKNKILINFGDIRAIRMFDEGIVQNGIYSDSEIQKYKKNRFENVIYEVEGGEFKQKVSEISLGFTDIINVKHYILVTQNFNIDIITDWEPKLEVNNI